MKLEKQKHTIFYLIQGIRLVLLFSVLGGNAYYWRFNMFKSGFMYPPGMRKPVIYLYPKKKTKITVKVTLTDAEFTNTYPKIDGDTWNVIASPDGTLTIDG